MEKIIETKLIWATPNGDQLVGYLARVSNSKAKLEDETSKLIKYLLDHKHFSPFEMVSACLEINTTRDIGRQILRHKSFSFQEFSQRYSEVPELYTTRECRFKGTTNRQSSKEVDPYDFAETTNLAWWNRNVAVTYENALNLYRKALNAGIAAEVARAILPEGLTPTKMYMAGNLRSWIHYWQVRCTPETQKEHKLVAEETREVVLDQFPLIKKALSE